MKCGRAYRQQAETGSLSESLPRQQNEKQKTLNDEMWTGLQAAIKDRLSLSESLLRQQKNKAENTKRRKADGLTYRKQRQTFSLNPTSGNKRKSRKH